MEVVCIEARKGIVKGKKYKVIEELAYDYFIEVNGEVYSYPRRYFKKAQDLIQHKPTFKGDISEMKNKKTIEINGKEVSKEDALELINDVNWPSVLWEIC